MRTALRIIYWLLIYAKRLVGEGFYDPTIKLLREWEHFWDKHDTFLKQKQKNEKLEIYLTCQIYKDNSQTGDIISVLLSEGETLEFSLMAAEERH